MHVFKNILICWLLLEEVTKEITLLSLKVILFCFLKYLFNSASYVQSGSCLLPPSYSPISSEQEHLSAVSSHALIDFGRGLPSQSNPWQSVVWSLQAATAHSKCNSYSNACCLLTRLRPDPESFEADDKVSIEHSRWWKGEDCCWRRTKRCGAEVTWRA